jgi:hypothetical protein
MPQCRQLEYSRDIELSISIKERIDEEDHFADGGPLHTIVVRLLRMQQGQLAGAACVGPYEYYAKNPIPNRC